MTLASDLRAMLPGIRAIPGELGLRPNRVYLMVQSYTENPGVNRQWESDIELTESGQPPKVTQLSDERQALSGMPAGSIEIGNITPNDALGEKLRGISLDQGDSFFIRVTGPLAGKYMISGLPRMDKALSWKIVAKPVSTANA